MAGRSGDARPRGGGQHPLPLAPPEALKVTHFSHQGEHFAVLSFEHLARALPGGLSETEAMVVLLALTGQSNRSIARSRAVTERTVANQLASAYRKLGIRSRGELVAVCSPTPVRPRAR